jgi:hypothetical protein
MGISGASVAKPILNQLRFWAGYTAAHWGGNQQEPRTGKAFERASFLFAKLHGLCGLSASLPAKIRIFEL